MNGTNITKTIALNIDHRQMQLNNGEFEVFLQHPILHSVVCSTSTHSLKGIEET